MQGKQVVIAGIALILVVGVAFGVVTLVNRDHVNQQEDVVSPQKKLVSSFCQSADFSETCRKTLSGLNGTDPKEYIQQAILSAQDSVQKFYNFSDSLVVKANNGTRTKMALEDCKDLMDSAVQSLQATFSSVGDAQIHTMDSRMNDLRTWLSAVIAYQQSCLDGFDENDAMKGTVGDGMDEVNELTSNALSIVTKLSEILGRIGLQLNVPTARRLLAESGYPEWFSAADRKLLGKIDNSMLKPNAVVAQDGSGQFKTIGAALAAAPKMSPTRWVIYVKAGIYKEYVMVDKKTTNILIYGDGPRKTIVTGSKNYAQGITTQDTATFTALGGGFIARSMGFQNTAGPEGHMAVALRVQSDKSAFFNCRMDGYQDTLYNHANRQFYRNCVISGTIDFIFGDSPTVIQNSLIVVRKPMENQWNAITAQGKKNPSENSALVIQGCRIVPDQRLAADRFKVKTYLGRPWKPYSTTIFMENNIGDFIMPEGWKEWAGTIHLDTLYYAEFNNRGPGANTARRVNWKGYHRNFGRKDAERFTLQNVLHSKENWLPATGVPFLAGLKY